MTSVVHHGHAVEVLRRMPEASVHCVVTSPPYWSLRDYGVPPVVWGGDRACAHESWGVEVVTSATRNDGQRRWNHGTNGRGEQQPNDARPGWNREEIGQGAFCQSCGAWRGCLGLEPTPELYVDHMVEVFDEVRRVLRPDGTVWLNLGDCYAAGGRGGDTGEASGLQGSRQHQEESKKAGNRIGSRSSFRRDRAPRGDVAHKVAPGLKPKDLIGIPWMVAFALRGRGWYLRSDIIWSKNNPMPESIHDRPTKSHEYVFLLANSEKYFYDAEAIREGVTGNAHTRGAGANPKALATPRGRNRANRSFSAAVTGLVGSRNRRSVWALSTSPFPGAHFATFPPKLVAPCILAGTSEHGCCSICGAPFRRVIELGQELLEQKVRGGCSRDGQYHGKATKAYDGTGAQTPGDVKARILAGMRERVTVGWKPTCRHTLREVEPCVVLDPFSGSGTTGVVAHNTGRRFIGIELNPEYIAMSTERMAPAEVSA